MTNDVSRTNPGQCDQNVIAHLFALLGPAISLADELRDGSNVLAVPDVAADATRPPRRSGGAALCWGRWGRRSSVRVASASRDGLLLGLVHHQSLGGEQQGGDRGGVGQ